MISSVHNPKIQAVRALLARRQEREQQQAFVAEGIRLLEEGFSAGWMPEQLFFRKDLPPRGLDLVEKYAARKVQIEEVAPNVLGSLADTETPQGILAVFKKRELPFPDSLDFLVILDQVHDPGNLGTIMRTAEAGGVHGVILVPGSVDPFSPKVVRAGMGAHFRLPLRTWDWDTIQQMRAQKSPRMLFILAEAGAPTACWDANFREPVGLLIGGEAEGVGEQSRQHADQLVSIPMPGKAESLNAGIAASLLIFEVVRQRSS